MTTQATRDHNLAVLADLGFSPAKWLPLERGREGGPRPPKEIAQRLCGLAALFFYVVAPPKHFPDDELRRRLDADALLEQLTPHEHEMLALPRARASADLGGTIGWHLEQMWPLAWALGFEPPPAVGAAMIPDEVVEAVLDFTSGRLGVDALVGRAKARSLADVAALEDLFYCAHNAVRSAQLGHDTVPKGFDPKVDGGVIHERRHALSWVMTPGVAWDDVDLST